MSNEYQLDPIANYHCRCGENPLWDDREGCVYWTDIPAGKIYRYDVATCRHRQIYEGRVVGGFTLQEDGALLLFGENRIWLWYADGREQVVAEDIDDDMTRFNDVIADPAGRVFAGTMSRSKGRAGLFRVDTDATITCLFRGTGTSNGLAFTPDRSKFYWTDSTGRRIFRFDCDADAGELTGREVFLEVGPDEGTPDGMTVDAAGGVWSARWDGWGLYHYWPDGELIEKVELPVAKVSSAIFGGPALDELYVTTAGGSADAGSADGTLYRLKLDATGLPEFRSRVGLG